MKQVSAPDTMGILYTAGYGNAQPDDFFAALRDKPIDLALDARLMPWGWHQLYRKEAFLRALEERGGVKRAKWTERLGNVAKRDGGEMRLADTTAIDDLVGVLAKGRNVLVICGCAKVEVCHRLLIATLAQALAPSLAIEHLPTPPPAPRTPRSS